MCNDLFTVSNTCTFTGIKNTNEDEIVTAFTFTKNERAKAYAHLKTS